MTTLFTDNFIHKLDTKKRVSIPASFRQSNDSEACEFVISKGSDTCIEVRPANVWDEFLQNMLSKLRLTNKKHKAYIRAYTQDATRVKCDKQGRILIPQKLLEFANIKDNVKIIGLGSIFEIWDIDTLEATESSQISPDDEYFADVEAQLQ
ncbi:MAG: division/cell wall cluster transcriptional repressor MraZ [Fidelibacterota bacterium]